jgi:hypothetical protein
LYSVARSARRPWPVAVGLMPWSASWPDLGFNLSAVSLAERAVLHQSATLMLQVECAQDELVSSAVVDADACIRLSSEARRLLAGLRKRAKSETSSSSPPPWSPLRASLAKAAAIGRGEV